MAATFAEVLGRHGVTVPDETIAELAVPILDRPQRQGDVFVEPVEPLDTSGMARVPPEGVAVVSGEATGNTHMLSAADGPVWFARCDEGVLLGWVHVPEGSVAYLVHTDEHGANGIGPGSYALRGKREQADAIRRVID